MPAKRGRPFSGPNPDPRMQIRRAKKRIRLQWLRATRAAAIQPTTEYDSSGILFCFYGSGFCWECIAYPSPAQPTSTRSDTGPTPGRMRSSSSNPSKWTIIMYCTILIFNPLLILSMLHLQKPVTHLSPSLVTRSPSLANSLLADSSILHPASHPLWDNANQAARAYGGGEGDLTKNLFPLQKSTPAYRILHHTLLKHREMVIPISL